MEVVQYWNSLYGIKQQQPSSVLVQQYLFAGKRHWYTSNAVIRTASTGGYPCEECGKRYKHRGNMRRHMVYECGKQAQFSCSHCSRKFHQQSNLKRHFETQHREPQSDVILISNSAFKIT